MPHRHPILVRRTDDETGRAAASTSSTRGGSERRTCNGRSGGVDDRSRVINLGALVLVLVLFVPLFAAEAQEDKAGRVWRIGVLWPGGSPPAPPRLESFRQGLRESGYVDGQNVAVELRYADSGERLRELAAELVRLNVSAIATFGDFELQLAQRTTTSIPFIVLTDDFVGSALAGNLARPGGHITGVSILAPELSVRRLELLKEMLPKVSRVAVLSDPATGSQLKASEAAARSLGVKLQTLEVRGRDDLGRAFQAVLQLAFAPSRLLTATLDGRRETISEWRRIAGNLVRADE